MKVLEFKREGFRDTVKSLRSIADRIENGDLLSPDVCVVVCKGEGSALDVFALGPKSDDLQVLGTLELGKSFIVDHITFQDIEE